MVSRLQIYRCKVCGNIVMVLHAGGGQLVCCGQPMKLLEEKTQEAGGEKHLPVIEKTAGAVDIKVGQIEHPMEQNHYIEWIEASDENSVFIKFLNPGDKPAVSLSGFKVKRAREYCTVHGLWKKEVET